MAVKGILLLTFTLFLFNEIRPIGRDKSRFRGMKSLRDEIRLRREIGTDLISSAKQISSERSEDFIAPCAISLKTDRICGTVNL